jgi:hypothetical protein
MFYKTWWCVGGKMMSTKQFANDLKRANGIEKALKIAERSANATKPAIRHSLPNGPVFYKKDKQGNEGLEEKELNKTYAFWVEVAGILRKLH